MEQSKLEGFYDEVIIDDLSEPAYGVLERFILEDDEGIVEIPQNAPGDVVPQPETVSMEVEMANGEAPSAEEPPTLDEVLPPPETIETDVSPAVESKDTTAPPVNDVAPK
ncbi:hypothetical protein DL98DRAFT_483518 [Cadophora sp. DSE1049]|nr:hypothetical protein DL98DRAFT_483518 [Cadophora sp. DSE1049]